MVDLLSPVFHIVRRHSQLMKNYEVHDSLEKTTLEMKISIVRGNGLTPQITKTLYPFMVRAWNNFGKSFKLLISLF